MNMISQDSATVNNQGSLGSGTWRLVTGEKAREAFDETLFHG